MKLKMEVQFDAFEFKPDDQMLMAFLGVRTLNDGSAQRYLTRDSEPIEPGDYVIPRHPLTNKPEIWKPDKIKQYLPAKTEKKK